MRHPWLRIVFELPSHGAQSHFQFLFKIELLQGFHLSRGSSDMNIIKIGDIKIFAGTPGPALTQMFLDQSWFLNKNGFWSKKFWPTIFGPLILLGKKF